MSMPHPARRALVTGGSGDIGGAICRKLGFDGLHVIVHANANRERHYKIAPAPPPDAAGNPRVVLFDWDGTLVDNWPVIHGALNDTLAETVATPKLAVTRTADGTSLSSLWEKEARTPSARSASVKTSPPG